MPSSALESFLDCEHTDLMRTDMECFGSEHPEIERTEVHFGDIAKSLLWDFHQHERREERTCFHAGVVLKPQDP